MTLTISVPAKHTELTLLGTLKSELEISGSSYDGLLTGLILQASDIIKTHTERTFAKETVIETLPAFGSNYLVLKRTPIVSITAITFDGSTISSTSYDIDNADAGILWRETGWTDTGILGQRIAPFRTGEGRRDWKVTYIAGYTTPGSTGSNRDLPDDVESACLSIIKSLFHSRADDPMVVAQKVGDASETRANSKGSFGIPPTALKILEKYRSIDI